MCHRIYFTTTNYHNLKSNIDFLKQINGHYFNPEIEKLIVVTYKVHYPVDI
jgi:hypothetical protein